MKRARKGTGYHQDFSGPAGAARLHRYEFNPRPRISFKVYYKVGRKIGYKTFADYRKAREYAASVVKKGA